MGIIRSLIVCQPHHLTHIERNVAEIINGVTPTRYAVRSICWVCERIKPIIRESSADPLK